MKNMNATLTSDELSRYARQINVIDQEGQHKLKQAKVLCIGAGGLGSIALMYLAGAGVGTIGIVEHDQVEISNLQRQLLYTCHDIGRKKIDVAQQKLVDINPLIKINTHNIYLKKANAADIIKEYDVVLDGSDNFATRYLVNDVCFKLNKPLIFASVSHFQGQCTVFFDENNPCLRCLFPEIPPPALIPNCAEGGVLGVLPAVMGSIQATEAIKLIIGIGKSLIGRLLLFNALDMRFNEITLHKDPHCKTCVLHEKYEVFDETQTCTSIIPEISVHELKNLKEQNVNFTLLDVREPFEYDICNLQGQLIPLNNLQSRLSEIKRDQLIVVYCKTGARSKQAVELLHQQEFSNVQSLRGGIMAWVSEIDPSLRKY